MLLIVDRLRYAIMTPQIEILYGNNENGGLTMRLDGYGLFVKDMPAMICFYRDVLGFEIKEDENTSNVYLLKDGTLFLLYGRNDFEKRTSKKYEYPQKAADFCAGH